MINCFAVVKIMRYARKFVPVAGSVYFEYSNCLVNCAVFSPTSIIAEVKNPILYGFTPLHVPSIFIPYLVVFWPVTAIELDLLMTVTNLTGPQICSKFLAP